MLQAPHMLDDISSLIILFEKIKVMSMCRFRGWIKPGGVQE